MTDETLIADLIRSGVDADLVQRVALAIIEAKATAQVAVVPDEAAERRRAADRARKAAQRESVRRNPQTSAESADIAEQPLPLSPSLPLSPQTPLSPAHPHAPTPAPAHTHARTREADETLTLTADPTPAKPSRKALMADDAAWLAELAKNPAYRGLNLETELGKMQAWCQLKGKTPSRARFLNWINGASTTERPMQTGRPPPSRHAAYTPERAHAKLAGRDPQDF